MKWFRLYDEIMDDPKLMDFSDKEKWVLIQIFCAVNRSEQRGKWCYSVSKLARFVHQKEIFLNRFFDKLESEKIISWDADKLGPFTVTNWNDRQYSSDDVNARVKKHREMKRCSNVSETLPVTPPDTDTDSDTESEKEKIKKERKIPFDDFKSAYPNRSGGKGSIPKAELKWKSLPVDEQKAALASLEEFKKCKQWRDNGGQFIPMIQTFLNQERWKSPPSDQKSLLTDKFTPGSSWPDYVNVIRSGNEEEA